MSCNIPRHEILFSPHCQAVLTWLADVGFSFTKRFADPHKFQRFPASFMKMVNPQHTMPTLQDNSFVLGKSRLLNKHYVTKIESDQIRKDLHLLRDQDIQTTSDRLLPFNIGIFYQKIIGYMHPRLVLDLPQVPEKRAVMERNPEYSEHSMKGTSLPVTMKAAVGGFVLQLQES